MRIVKKMLFLTAAVTLLVSCSGLYQMRALSPGPVKSTNITKAGLSGINATINIEMVNRSKKSITFAEGSMNLLSNDDLMARLTLTAPATIPAGESVVAMPVRINFSRAALGQIVIGVLNGPNFGKQNYRLQGSITLESEKSGPKSFKFSRRLPDDRAEGLIDQLNLNIHRQ